MPGIGEFLHEHLITSVQSSGAFWPDQARQTRAKNAEREGYGGLPDKVINDYEKLTFPLSLLADHSRPVIQICSVLTLK